MKSNETNSQPFPRISFSFITVAEPGQRHRGMPGSHVHAYSNAFIPTCVQLMNWHRPINPEPGYYVPKSLVLSLLHTHTHKHTVTLALSPMCINVIRRYCRDMHICKSALKNTRRSIRDNNVFFITRSNK